MKQAWLTSVSANVAGLKAIESVVAERYCEQAGYGLGEFVGLMHGETRIRPVAEARRVVMAMAIESGYSYSDIGRFYGRKHATAIHAARQIRALRDAQPDFAVEYTKMREAVKAK